jgi:hypothetical protein
MNKYYQQKIIDGRVHLEPYGGFVITDGNGLYSRYLILEIGADESVYYTISEYEYERILAEQEKANELI